MQKTLCVECFKPAIFANKTGSDLKKHRLFEAEIRVKEADQERGRRKGVRKVGRAPHTNCFQHFNGLSNLIAIHLTPHFQVAHNVPTQTHTRIDMTLKAFVANDKPIPN